MAAMNIPMAIFRGVEMSLPLFFLRAENTHITMGVRVITKNGLTACQISGAMDSVVTKSRANTDRD
ncbi:unknown [Alistipes sp. CAG:831]|nr:unknown [Alistipes sp. CAG:831]